MFFTRFSWSLGIFVTLFKLAFSGSSVYFSSSLWCPDLLIHTVIFCDRSLGYSADPNAVVILHTALVDDLGACCEVSLLGS